MREILSDLLKHTSSLFPRLHVHGTATDTYAMAMDVSKSIIFRATLKAPLGDFAVGESVLSNLSMLRGLLDFPSYNSEGSTVTPKAGKNRRTGEDIVENIEFTDAKGAGATFRLTDIKMVKDEERPPQWPTVGWEMEFEPNKSNVDEFSRLASLYSEVEKTFTPKTQAGDLRFYVGEENSSAHSASIVFEENVSAQIKGGIKYSVDSFQSVLKIGAKYPTKLHLTGRGLMMVSFETPYAVYEYLIRAQH